VTWYLILTKNFKFKKRVGKKPPGKDKKRHIINILLPYFNEGLDIEELKDNNNKNKNRGDD